MPFHQMSRAARVHRAAIVPFIIALFGVAASTAIAAAQAHGPPDFEQFHAQPEQIDQPEQNRKPEQISEYVREVFQDRDGVYWFGTNGDGLARFDGESLTYISFDDGLAGIAIRGILQSPDGALWFATESGVSRYESGTFTNYTTDDGLSNSSIWSIMQDSAGTIWVGTHAGVCRFDGVSFVPFPLPRVEVANPESRFSPLVVFAMFEDRAGTLWFGTDGEGAHRYDGAAFTSYTAAEGLAGNMVRAITGDRHGHIWLGTNGDGASRFDGTTFRNFTSEDGLNNDRIYEILEDSAGTMWFSTLGAGASRYDGTSFTAFREDHSLIINDRPARTHVQEFFEDRDGVLWIGCSGGLFYFDGETFINVTRDGPWPKSRQEPASTKAADGSIVAHQPVQDPISLEGWPSETFALPPGFAPELPTGRESLRFAPGWRKPATEDFWSYAFVMWIDEPAPDAARVQVLLEDYYNGLLTVFAGNKNKDISDTPARITVSATSPNHFEAQMHVIDAFATFEPIDLRVRVDTAPDADGHSTVHIRVSPQPAEHRIWESLEAAIADILRQDETAARTDHGEAEPLEDPLAAFTRMIEGHWRLTLQSGSNMDTTWRPGPGGHSLHAVTEGRGGGGEPWRSLQVLYRHPQDERTRTFGVSSYAGSVSVGTIEFDGEAAEAAIEIYQKDPGTAAVNRRLLGRRWEFEGHEKYAVTLWDDGEPPMGRWEHSRRQAPVTPAPHQGGNAPEPPEHFRALMPLLGHAWETEGDSATGPVDLRTTFEYVPFADYIYGRTVTPADDGEPAHLLDTYIYHHTGTGKLSVLALSAIGGVYEGVVTLLADGSVQCSLSGYEGQREVPLVANLVMTESGAADHLSLRDAEQGELVRLQASPHAHGRINRGGAEEVIAKTSPQRETTPGTNSGATDAPAITVADIPSLLGFGSGIMPGGRVNGGVRSILEDSEGNYWFGSWMEGVARFDGTNLTYFTENEGLSDNQIRTIVEGPDGIIWFECGTGISSYDGEQVVTHTGRNFAETDAWRLEADSLWFKGDETVGFNQREGQPGVYRYDGEEFTFLAFPLREDRAGDGGYSVTGMARGEGGRLWFATYQGVIGYDGESFTYIDDDSLGLTEETGFLHTRCVFEDSKGRLWIGNNGIGVILREGDTTTNFTQQQGVGRRDSRSGGGTTPQPGDAGDGAASLHRVFSIGEDRDGNIWFGTVEQGAWRYDGETLRHFSEKDGLTSEGIMAIYTDSRGHLLLGGNGVFRFNGETFDRVH